ncbi:hypothetical protein [Stutzerimonas stutzeri]|uniref:hypothetical protein n=1 Tax=Stutzerimonas stutzeri TaxID=316 RepID=UPI003C6F9C40
MKPDPYIYQYACRDLGVQPGRQLRGDRIVMIGDSIGCLGMELELRGALGFTYAVKGGATMRVWWSLRR